MIDSEDLAKRLDKLDCNMLFDVMFPHGNQYTKLNMFIEIERKESEIEEHKHCCQDCYNKRCKEILIKGIELQNLKNKLKEME